MKLLLIGRREKAKSSLNHTQQTVSILIVLTLMTSSLGILFAPKTSALSGSQFQAGDIIDDGVFYDSSTMNALDIQFFLNSKVPSCDTNGSKIYSGSQTRAQYGASQGSPAPYTCLRDYRQDTPGMGAEAGLCNNFISGNRSSAQIIKDVATACGINPQVLLVLLQKEQSLVTDEWPWPIQYVKATGFGCPDTAPCDTSFGGFFYQVYYAARQFKKYQRDEAQFGYRAFRNNSIQYSPISSCGSTSVYIQNRSTAGLYNYTPYQPNQAALNNLYGTGDDCSAYGNRNFWRMFNDWFGSTLAKPYQWQLNSQESFVDASRTKLANVDALNPNTTYYMRVRAQNMGNRTWHNTGVSTINLATTAPQNRVSELCDSSWLSCARPATLQESSVNPGDVGTFEFSVHTPNAYGTLREYFSLVAEGDSWMNDLGMNWSFHIRPPVPLWQPVTQEAYLDTGRTKTLDTSVMAPNTTYYVRIRSLNTGNNVWTNSGSNPTRLGTNNPQDKQSAFCDSSWLSCSRAATLKEASVGPGDVGTFEFSIHTPNTYGTFNEYFRPVVEGSMWMNDVGLFWPLSVRTPTALWQLSSQSLYTDSSKSTQFDSSKVPNNTRYYAVVRAKNTGNNVWTNSGSNPTRLGTNNPQDKQSAFCDSSWLSCSRAATLKEASVGPGDVGTFEFWMKSPYSTDNVTLSEYFRPVIEGSAWMNDIGMYLSEKTLTGKTQWGYLGQAAYSDQARTSPVDLASAKVATKYYLTLSLKNTSGVIWQSNSFHLGTSNQQDRISSLCTTAWLTCARPAALKESSVNPGATGTFQFEIKTTASPTTTDEYFKPLIEGDTWLQDLGQFWHIVTTP